MNKKIYCPKNGCGQCNGAAPVCSVECKHCNYGSDNIHKQPYTLANLYKLCPSCEYCLSCGRISKDSYIKIIDKLDDWVEGMKKLFENYNKEKTNLSLPEDFIELCKSVGIEII